MSEILVENKTVVIPGEILAKGMDYLPGENTYREGEQIFSKSVGLTSISGRVIKVTSLSGPYKPKDGDKIICKVFDITLSGWRLKTNTAYNAMLNVKDATRRFVRKDEDLTKIIDVNDYIVAKVIRVTSQKLIDLSMNDPDLFKINGGRIIKINSQKVPRVIGKQGSMVSMIKKFTNCDITVGQNGLIFVRKRDNGNECLAEKAIKLVEKEAHIGGLTERVETFLKSETNQ
ncbi:RNA-binding protein [archaeon]|jgi:exosome complex component RRP4|nr:RNA-binding protein [archaeon]MBT3451383.1 RNA-binding protein [archaeon]MBT6868961.1 RNA-binding protein [archaeon]MBT7193227.1 RNA-binding protein [archaeon]MBT7380082.1 RNA-binding protein [archaeon]